ncbi:MAG: hypothetical protein Tsb0020_52100 [Haliangiales bacterium]
MSLLTLAVGVAVALVSLPDKASAEPAKRARFCLLLNQVTVAEGVPSELVESVRARTEAAIAAHAELSPALPEQAPDPAARPKAFSAFMKRRGLHAYRLNVEITSYRHELSEGRRGQELTVHVGLRTFGETMPKPAIGFTGDGQATIKLEIGRTLRDRDTRAGNREAVELAVEEALSESVRRLEEKYPPKRRRARQKKN